MKPKKISSVKKISSDHDNRDIVIKNQKHQIRSLRKKIQSLESKMIALGY